MSTIHNQIKGIKLYSYFATEALLWSLAILYMIFLCIWRYLWRAHRVHIHLCIFWMRNNATQISHSITTPTPASSRSIHFTSLLILNVILLLVKQGRPKIYSIKNQFIVYSKQKTSKIIILLNKHLQHLQHSSFVAFYVPLNFVELWWFLWHIFHTFYYKAYLCHVISFLLETYHTMHMFA